MPRIANIYAVPVGTDGVPDETVDANKYNIFIHDLELDLNAPRPISAGGTGANTAHDALVNLHGEETKQIVTNYDTFPFVAGSFSSAPGATGTPDGFSPAVNGYAGICYVYDPVNTYMALEARNLSTDPGIIYIRQKTAGVWGSWRNAEQSSIDLANTKVSKSGDTMSGNLLGQTIDAAGEVVSRIGTFRFDAVGGTKYLIYDGVNFIFGGGHLGILNGGINAVGGINSDSAIQAKGGIYYFQDNTKYLTWDTGTSAYKLVGGALQVLSGAYFFNDNTKSLQWNGGTGYFNLAGGHLGILNGGINATGGISTDSAVQAKLGVYYFQDNAKYLEWNTGTSAYKLVGGALQVLSGAYFFNDTAKSLQWDNGIGAFHLIGGSFWVDGTVGSMGGTIYLRSLAAGNATFWLQDETGANKASLAWNRATGRTEINTGASNVFAMGTTGIINTANGMYGKAGSGAGAYDANAHNFYWTGSAAQVWIDATNVGTLTITCDYRIKKDVVPLASTWDAVKALKPISYTQAEFTSPSTMVLQAQQAAAREADPKAQIEAPPATFVADDIPRWGFIAHELQETLLPSAATGEKDSPNEVQSPNVLAIVAALTRALQEAMTRIEALETSLAATSRRA